MFFWVEDQTQMCWGHVHPLPLPYYIPHNMTDINHNDLRHLNKYLNAADKIICANWLGNVIHLLIV